MRPAQDTHPLLKAVVAGACSLLVACFHPGRPTLPPTPGLLTHSSVRASGTRAPATTVVGVIQLCRSVASPCPQSSLRTFEPQSRYKTAQQGSLRSGAAPGQRSRHFQVIAKLAPIHSRSFPREVPILHVPRYFIVLMAIYVNSYHQLIESRSWTGSTLEDTYSSK